MNKLVILLIVALGVFCLFYYNQASKNSGIAQAYQAERDSLLIANKCPQPLRVRIYTGACLNAKAARHDLDLHVSNLKTAAGDTVGFMPLCDSCFEELLPEARWTFYEKLLWIYEQRNRQDVKAQVRTRVMTTYLPFKCTRCGWAIWKPGLCSDCQAYYNVLGFYIAVGVLVLGLWLLNG